MIKSFDKKNMTKSRAVCEAMTEAANTGKRVLTGREYQILDMWPKFEDGEPVMIGDGAVDGDDERFTVLHIEAAHRRWVLKGPNGQGNKLVLKPRERVKRPVQSVLDADGVEIKVGDTVWFRSFSTGNRMCRATVTGFGERNLDVRLATVEDEAGRTWNIDPKRITHTPPDSWERLTKDMHKSPCAYFGFLDRECDEGEGCPARGPLDCRTYKSIDITHRADALAGAEMRK